MTYKRLGSWGLTILGIGLVALNEWVALLIYLATAYLTTCIFMSDTKEDNLK